MSRRVEDLELLSHLKIKLRLIGAVMESAFCQKVIYIDVDIEGCVLCVICSLQHFLVSFLPLGMDLNQLRVIYGKIM